MMPLCEICVFLRDAHLNNKNNSNIVSNLCNAITSPETIFVPVIYASSRQVDPTATFLVTGASLTPELRNHAHYSYRFMIFEFNNIVDAGSDDMLPKITAQQAAAFLQKSSLAYVEFCNQINLKTGEFQPRVDIFDFVPDSFRKAEKKHFGLEALTIIMHTMILYTSDPKHTNHTKGTF